MKKIILIIFVSLFCFFQPSCLAMQVTSTREIAEFSTDKLWNDVSSVRTIGQWNEYVRFTFYMPNNYNGTVRGDMLISGDSNDIHFSFLPGSIIKIFEFKTTDPDMVFWVLKDNALNGDDSTHNFYMVGPYQDHYVTYANMDNLTNMGWDSSSMKIHLLSDTTALPVLQGYDESGNPKENLVLSWDDAASWFGMTSYPLDTPVNPIPGE